MPDSNYPYGDTARALEQMGWLKAQMDQAATKTDLAEFRAEIKDFLRGELDRRDKTMLSKVSAAFKQAMPGTQALVDARINERLQEKEDEFARKLKRLGMRIGETGEIEYIVHPAKKAVRRNLAYIVIAGLAATIANPDLAFSVGRFLYSIVN